MSAGERNGWEALFHSVFERSRNPMALIDARLRLVAHANAAMAQLFGTGPADLEGRSVDDLVDAERLRGPRLTWERLADDPDYRGETAVTAPDGTALRLHYAASAAEVAGRRLILVVVSETEAKAGGVADDAPDEDPNGTLTPREREVLRMVALGLNSREISQELHLSVDTVRRHVANAMARTGARTRAQLVALAMAGRLIG